MNARQLEKLGVPIYCANEAIAAIQKLARDGNLHGKAIKETIKIILSGDESLASKYTYAIFDTILAVVALPNGRPSGTNLIDFSFATKRSSLRD